MTTLRNIVVHLLGKPSVLLEGNSVSIPRARCRAIVFYLSAKPHPVSRAKIMDLFWPYADQATAQHNLNVALYEIRKRLPGLVERTKTTLWVSSNVVVDTRTIESILDSPNPHDDEILGVLSLFRGDFLEDFNVGGAPDFESWKAVMQSRFEELHVQGLERAARIEEKEGRDTRAVSLLHRAIQIDPLRESLYRHAMVLLYKSGDIAGVSRIYEALDEIMRAELGVPPQRDTQAIYRRIMSNHDERVSVSEPASDPDDARPPQAARALDKPSSNDSFYGRGAELQRLSSAISAGGLTVIHSTPGLGKSRLVDEFARFWKGLVLRGYCLEFELDIPYCSISYAIRRLAKSPAWITIKPEVRRRMPSGDWDALRYLVPEIDSNAPTPQASYDNMFRFVDALSRLLEVLASKQGILFIIDDIQWADNYSLVTMSNVIQRHRGANVSFLATADDSSVNADFLRCKESLSLSGDLEELPLQPLGRDGIQGFAERIQAEPDEELVDWLEQVTHGNAFLLEEFTRFYRNELNDAPDAVKRLAELMEDFVIPESVERFFLTAARSGPEDERRVLEAAAVAGTVFEFPQIVAATGFGESVALECLERLMSKKVIRMVDDRRFAFDHALMREVIFRSMLSFRRELFRSRIDLSTASS